MHLNQMLNSNEPNQLVFITLFLSFTTGPSWSRSRHVYLCVCLFLCRGIKSQGSKGGPRGAKQSPIVFEASHWLSDHMIRSRPLIFLCFVIQYSFHKKKHSLNTKSQQYNNNYNCSPARTCSVKVGDKKVYWHSHLSLFLCGGGRG